MSTPASLIADREVLYFIYGDGCAACEAAKPEFETFMSKHPRLMSLTINAAGPHPERLGLKVKATPTYFFRRGQEGVVYVGVMRATEIERWLKKLGSTSL